MSLSDSSALVPTTALYSHDDAKIAECLSGYEAERHYKSSYEIWVFLKQLVHTSLYAGRKT